MRPGKKSFLVFALAVACFCAQAQQALRQKYYSTNIITPGEGFTKCGDWLEYRRKPNHPREEIMRVYMWGWLSGVVGSSAHYHTVTLPNGTAISAWMDRYCRENPLNDVLTGSAYLLEELATTRR